VLMISLGWNPRLPRYHLYEIKYL